MTYTDVLISMENWNPVRVLFIRSVANVLSDIEYRTIARSPENHIDC